MEVILLFSVGAALIIILMLMAFKIVADRISAPTKRINQEVEALQARVNELEKEKDELSK